MFKSILIGLTLALSFGGWTSGAAQSNAAVVERSNLFDGPNLFNGQWVNDRNSAATFAEKDGLLTGFYQTALGQPNISKKFPLTGFVEGDQITFTVNFKGYGSLTSWTGQLTEDASGKPYIRTLWNLTRDVLDEDEPDDMWSSIVSGASDFRPVENQKD